MINPNYWTPNYVWPTYLGRLMASVRFLLLVCLNSKTLMFYFFSILSLKLTCSPLVSVGIRDQTMIFAYLH